MVLVVLSFASSCSFVIKTISSSQDDGSVQTSVGFSDPKTENDARLAERLLTLSENAMGDTGNASFKIFVGQNGEIASVLEKREEGSFRVSQGAFSNYGGSGDIYSGNSLGAMLDSRQSESSPKEVSSNKPVKKQPKVSSVDTESIAGLPGVGGEPVSGSSVGSEEVDELKEELVKVKQTAEEAKRNAEKAKETSDGVLHAIDEMVEDE